MRHLRITPCGTNTSISTHLTEHYSSFQGLNDGIRLAILCSALAIIFLQESLMSASRTVLPRSLFFSISRDLTSGDPTWKLLIINEYLDKQHPLRKALSLLIKNSPQGAPHPSLLDAALSGTRYSELSEKAQLQLKSTPTSLQHKQKSIPLPRRRECLRNWSEIRTVRRARKTFSRI